MAAANLSQLPIEVLQRPGTAVSQAAVELAVRSDAPLTASVSQLPVELLVAIMARLSQQALELLIIQAPGSLLSQLAIELLQQPTTKLSQQPLEIAVLPSRLGWQVTIDGTDRTGIVDAVTISSSVNERARATIVLADYLPPKFAEIVSYAKDGQQKIFGGVIVTRHVTGRNPYDPTFTVSLECGDFFTYADWVAAALTYDQPVTLRTVLQDLVGQYLSAYGITLDPGQVDGPALAPFVWQGIRVSDALRELSDRTGYVARITPTKVLRMFIPGTDAAPFTLTEAAPHCQELSWADTEQVAANHVTVIAGPTGQRDVIDEQHAGDGITQAFPLYAPFVEIIGALYVWSENVFYPVGIYGQDDAPWTYEAATNTIHHHAGIAPLQLGDGFTISYGAVFPFAVTATNGATPVIHYTEARPDVLSIPAAQEIANQLLAKLSGAPRELVITTDEDGFVPGQALTIDLPITRQIAGAFTITEVGMTIVQDTGPDDEYWVYTLKALESTRYQGSYLDDWRRLTVAPSSFTPAEGASTRRRPPG